MPTSHPGGVHRCGLVAEVLPGVAYVVTLYVRAYRTTVASVKSLDGLQHVLAKSRRTNVFTIAQTRNLRRPYNGDSKRCGRVTSSHVQRAGPGRLAPKYFVTNFASFYPS
jgi:hypothetical protein